MKLLLVITLLIQSISYQDVFQHLKGKEKIDAINKMVYKNDTLKTNVALALVEKALVSANSNNYSKGIMQAKANQAILLTNLKEDSVSFNAMMALKDLDDQAFLAPFQAGINEGLAKLHFSFGLIEKGNEYYQKAIAVHEKNEDIDHIVLTYIDQGSKNAKRGFYNNGLTYFLEAYQISLRENHTQHLPDIYRYLANVYNRLKSFEKAKEFTWKSIDHYIGNDQKLSKLADGYLTLAGIYVFEENDDSAAFHYHEALRLYDMANDDLGIAYAAANISDVFLNLKQLDSCKYYLDLASVSIKKSGFYKNLEAYINFKMAEVLCLSDKYDEAKVKAHAALSLSIEQRDLEFIKTSYETLAKIYEKINQPDSALFFFKRYHSYSDSVNNSNIEKKFASQRIKIETIEKENKILSLSKADIENKAIIKNTSFWLTVLTIGICLLLIFITLLIIIFKQRLASTKQRASMEAILITQENERQRMAKDLHDSVGAMIASIKINFQHEVVAGGSNYISHESNLVELLDQTSNEIRRIAHNMMPGSLKKFGLLKALTQLVEQNNLIANIDGEIESFGMENRLPQNVELNLYRITQELTQNIIKHANATHYRVQITRHKNSLNLIVEDDGKGFNPDLPNESCGIGLDNMISRVTYLKGTWQIDSNSGIGTSILIEIPLSN